MQAEQHATYAGAFAPGLFDPALSAPADLIASHDKGVVKRYNVYRNNVTVSLIDALAAIYPAVQRITGVEFFRAMARFHVRATPPNSPLLFEYGRDFPGFIESYQYARDMPWLADTARIERAWLDAYHAADAAPLTTQAFAAVEAGSLAQLRFIAHPAARIVRSRYPAVSIFAMNRKDGPVEPLHASDAQDALVTRPDQDVIVWQLPAGGAAFLLALIAGVPLGAAVEAALQDNESFDIHINLQAMITAGVFTAIRSGAPS